MASRTTPYDVQSIAGYPDALQIYRIPASHAWQVRLFVDRKYVRKSTGTDDKKLAIEFAKKFYDTIRINQRLDVNVHTDTFNACAQHLLRREEALVQTNQRDRRIVIEDRRKLKLDILPFFGMMGVADISASTLDDYLANLGKRRKLAPSTISKHLIVIRKVMIEAQRRGFIKALPPFPTIRRKDNPRPYFTLEEYRTLRATAKKLASEEISVRGVPLTEEIYDFIVFAVNVFVRPSDCRKLLRHRHVRIVPLKQGAAEILSIIPPHSKTAVRESFSTPAATAVYRSLRDYHSRFGRSEPSDFVFFPQYLNREYALVTIRRQFEFVLGKAELRKDRFDRNRTIYSLRHTALMHQFLEGKVNILALAKSALTSVDQLERFYLSHAVDQKKLKGLLSVEMHGLVGPTDHH